MRRDILLVVTLSVFLGPSAAFASAHRLAADKDSSFMSYHVYHLFHSVDGISRHVSCDIAVDSSTHRITSVTMESDVNSFDSGNKARDKTAMRAIESDRYPLVVFQSDSISYDSDTTLNVKGLLSFHGVAREVAIPVIIISKTNEIICEGSLGLDFHSFNVERPRLVFIPIGSKFIVRFRLVFDGRW